MTIDGSGDAAEACAPLGRAPKDAPNAKYRDAHLWAEARSDNFTAYKRPVTDARPGSLHVVPRGLIPGRDAMQGGRGGVDLPRGIERVKSHLAKYYAKLDEQPPWEK